MKNKIKVDTIIFDFDSTLLRGELLEILADCKLATSPDRQKVLKQIKRITNLGMEGKIPFHESLRRRLTALDLDEDVLEEAMPKIISLVNQEYLELDPTISSKKKYIISGGYTNIIYKLEELLNIPTSQMFAIDLNFKDGRFCGFDTKSPLAESHGKATVAKSLGSKGATIMIGDGMTDYMVKDQGGADYFAAYTGVVERKAVCDKADFVLKDLRELTSFIC